MAIKLPSNYTLRSNAFLDSRQGPYLKNNLKDWDFEENPIPLGFEVFVLEESNGIIVEENWYTYNSIWSEETGYFKLRVAQGVIIEDDTTTPTPIVPEPVVLPEGLLIIGNEIGEVD